MGIDGLAICPGWESLATVGGNVSYSSLFSRCSFDSRFQVPTNMYGYAWPESHGEGINNYSMITTFMGDVPNGRTYIIGELKDPFPPGQLFFEFDVLLANQSMWSCASIGVLFFKDKPTSYSVSDGFNTRLSFNGTFSPNWLHFKFDFATIEPFNYFIIGALTNDGLLTCVQRPGVLGVKASVFYIDNVCVKSADLDYCDITMTRTTHRTPIKMAPTFGTYTDVDHSYNTVATVTNIHGIEVIRTRSKRIDFGNLPKGVYFVRVSESVGTFLRL